ncbi:MAG: trypsin-like peptidase domain-containing protein [Deltaproteobacteria bacterium]|nr:trypsin-like peptidase domain-containing protein [Deltaproteobacteria bacterium]
MRSHETRPSGTAPMSPARAGSLRMPPETLVAWLKAWALGAWASLALLPGLTLLPATSAFAANDATANSPPPVAAPRAAQETAGWASLQDQIIAVSEQVKPLVVHIEAIVKINDRRKHVEGSGFIVDADGTIVTNQHVVDKAQKVEVTIPGRTHKYPATIVGADKQTDVAVLKIEPDGDPLPVARFGSVDDLRVGQWVLAVGNPYGLDGTVSLGIVSAKGRNLEVDKILNDFIQTDAMIDRGSSGGPLVDLDGRVVGINSRGQGRGIGFTIPIDTALDVVAQLRKGGVERGWIGITIQPLNRDLADYFELADTTGVIVNSISSESPARAAGLEPGDLITGMNGEPVEAEKEEDLGDFQRRVAAVSPGETIDLAIQRDGETKTLSFALGVQPHVVPEEEETDLGFHVQEITEITYREQRLQTREGAYVRFVERGSPASESGLKTGDVIEKIEDGEVTDLETFREAIEGASEKDVFLITARRGDMLKYLLMKRGEKPAAVEDGEAETDTGEASHSSSEE